MKPEAACSTVRDQSARIGHSREATPVPGCDTCGHWELKLRRAEADGDLSLAVDCRVQIRRHASHGGT